MVCSYFSEMDTNGAAHDSQQVEELSKERDEICNQQEQTDEMESLGVAHMEDEKDEPELLFPVGVDGREQGVIEGLPTIIVDTVRTPTPPSPIAGQGIDSDFTDDGPPEEYAEGEEEEEDVEVDYEVLVDVGPVVESDPGVVPVSDVEQQTVDVTVGDIVMQEDVLSQKPHDTNELLYFDLVVQGPSSGSDQDMPTGDISSDQRQQSIQAPFAGGLVEMGTQTIETGDTTPPFFNDTIIEEEEEQFIGKIIFYIFFTLPFCCPKLFDHVIGGFAK
jgi:hypothetical protein